MKQHIRVFNDNGINHFRHYLQTIAVGENSQLPSKELLESDDYSTIAAGDVEIDQLFFTSKEDIVKYLLDKIHFISEHDKYYSQGLWTWLSAFYFDSVCPLKNGRRQPGSEVRHILASKEWNRYYRHLLAAPVRLISELNDKGKIYLTGTPNKHGDLFEQLASRNEYATSLGIVEAATLLYWDIENQKIKKGARNKDTHPGVLRRFTGAVLPQFTLTYDVNGMSGTKILEMLPREFSKWK